MGKLERRRRVSVICVVVVVAIAAVAYGNVTATRKDPPPSTTKLLSAPLAIDVLAKLRVQGRASHNGYNRSLFGGEWQKIGNCDMRNRILQRDLDNVELDTISKCIVLKGILRHDPYTGKTVPFARGSATSQRVQIDHIVAVADAWQKGAQYLDTATRTAFYNDPLNLVAVDGTANIRKSNSDAASWLPPNKPYRCRYIARQIAVKSTYDLWVTEAERTAMRRVLQGCPGQVIPLRANG